VAEKEKVEQVKEEEERGEEAEEEEEPLRFSLRVSQRLRRFFKALAVVVDDEATIHVEEQRLWARAMNAERCTMVCVELTTDELLTAEGKFCVNVEDVVRVFKLFPSLDKMRVADGYLMLKSYGEDEVRLRLLDLPMDELPEPMVGFEAKGKMSLYDIYTCKRLNFEWVRLVAKKGNLYVYGGDSSRYASIKLKTGTAEGVAVSAYSVSYRYDAVRIFGKHGSIRACFGEDKPLLLEEKSSRSEELTIRYWIAPRIIE